MKKKIKDLTEQERDAICERSFCSKCLLCTKHEDVDGYIITECFKDLLEREVEVPEGE